MAKKSEKIKLSPPWDAHMQMLASFFNGDSRITVVPGTEKAEGKKNVVIGKIGSNDADCLLALETAIAKEVEFGNVKLEIEIVPENGKTCVKAERKLKAGKKLTPLAALKEVLKKNPAFLKFKTGRFGDRTLCYCIFKPVVLQWYNDNLGSPWKLGTCTYEGQADFVFDERVGALFCTAPKGAK